MIEKATYTQDLSKLENIRVLIIKGLDPYMIDQGSEDCQQHKSKNKIRINHNNIEDSKKNYLDINNNDQQL